jgi:hypothetical protein
MRPRRTSALLAAVVAVTLAVVVGSPSPVAARPSTKAAAGRPWTLAGHSCRLIATAATTPVVDSAGCSGVRPGAPVLTPVGQCTLNFLWRGTDGRSYIGTAGHCLLEGSDVRQVVFGPGDGPPARDGTGRRIGEFAYAALDESSDFALIRLDAGVPADPQVCQFGGPTGLDVGVVPGLTALQYVGRGTLTGNLAPARTQLALDGDTRFVTGLGVASAGDSGSPLVGVDGRAIGVVVATGPALPFAPTGLFVFSMRVAPEMGRAGAAMGLGFELVTAPLGGGLFRP